jgi:hypothetical protein
MSVGFFLWKKQKYGHVKNKLQGHTVGKKYGRFSGKNKIWT